MAVRHLTEQQVHDLISMRETIPVVRHAFSALGKGLAMNIPRSRAKAPGIVLHNMHATADYLGCVGAKLYTTTRERAEFHILIFNQHEGELIGILSADHLGCLRTGAATGVATDVMARRDATRVGIIGAGHQARAQLQAVCTVRDISDIRVFCRDPEHRATFAKEMTDELGVKVSPVDEADDAVRKRDIVITATTSSSPVFDGAALGPGTHINLVGSNDLRRSEVDVMTISRSDRIACDQKEACRTEAGDFVAAIVAGVTNFEEMHEISNIVNGEIPGRERPEEITLFKSVGLAIEDVAVGHELLRRAHDEDVGNDLRL